MALAERQSGVVTRPQLYELGLSARTLSRRVGDGLWLPRGRDVLVLRGTPDDLITRSRVAGLRHPDSVLAGPSAAALTGDGPWVGIDLGDRPWLVGRRKRSFQRDRTRQNRLINAGWTVLRYTWEDANQRPEQVLSEIGAACSRATSR